MKRAFPLAATIAFVLAAAATDAVAQERAKDALRQDLDFARGKVYPALVNIGVVSRDFSGGRTQRAPAAGSGVIVSPGGHVLTNFHVAGNTTQITCTLPTGEQIDADVVTHDPMTDLSVLKLRLDRRTDTTLPIPFAALGDSAALHVGDYVLAMGNPLALSSSMTLGVVSNTKRVFTDFTGTDVEDMDLGAGERTGVFTRWIQHDALILPGNSGGPLVNLRGEVVGINELGGSGMGFAIPSNLAAQVLNQALTYAEVRRGWLGITVLPVRKIGRDTGALISAVGPASPAEKAGLQPGDILLALDDQPVNVRFFEEVPLLYQQFAEMTVGREVAVTVLRKGQETKLKATVARMEKFRGEEEECLDMGITVEEITGPMALARRYTSTEGVIVTGLRPGQRLESARPAIQGGDVLLAIDGKPVKDLASFRTLIAAIGKSQEFVVAYRRRDEQLVTLVKALPDKPSKSGKELPKAWLGVRSQVVTPDVAKAIGSAGTKGFRVTEVLSWTEAANAGFQVGDVIVAIAGTKLTASRPQDAEDLRRTVEDLPIGDKAEFTVLRKGAEVKLSVMMQEHPSSAIDAKSSQQKELEFAVREVTFPDRIEHKWDKDQKGVLVVDVTMGGWASMAGLQTQDLVVTIAGKEVSDIPSFEKDMQEVLKSRPKVVEFFVRRGYRTHFVFVSPDWAKVPEAK
ncbi:MAG: PDZ domain-containing protein [Planctomycetes bacterium]|nr:PDZ domain-containing protein [Planctomycetota bacterium]